MRTGAPFLAFEQLKHFKKAKYFGHLKQCESRFSIVPDCHRLRRNSLVRFAEFEHVTTHDLQSNNFLIRRERPAANDSQRLVTWHFC